MANVRLEFKNEVESTNKVLKQAKQIREGVALIAVFQSSGKGMGSNQWESLPGENITGSIVFEPKFLEPSEGFLVSMAVACGIIDFLQDFEIYAKVKWPNDIYVNDKKLAGILIENEFTGRQISRNITGIGLNVNQTDFKLAPNPTSLKLITGEQYIPHSLAKELFTYVYNTYEELQNNRGNIIEKYHSVLLGRDLWLSYKDETGMFQGKIQSVDVDGQIHILDQDNTLRSYYFKEVEMLSNSIT
jgi:BirA family biotin operon repressor/biotin-[acetyl-CoA-carboxylase] ligase